MWTDAEILRTIGVPAPGLAAWMTTLIELFGGFALLAGAFVPIVSIPLVIIMLVTLLTVHLPYGFSSIKLMTLTANGAEFGKIGYELNLLYIAALLALGGASPFSIDYWLVRRQSRRPSLAVAEIFALKKLIGKWAKKSDKKYFAEKISRKLSAL